jgi:hypothetical protein
MDIQKIICKKVLPIAVLLIAFCFNLAFCTKNGALRPLHQGYDGQFYGKNRRAIAVNGQIPMPTLTFTEGDTAEIYVHNELNETTSLALARAVFAQQRGRRAELDPNAHRAAHDAFVQISHYPARHALVSQPFGFAGANWDVRLFCDEKRTAGFRKGIDDLPTVPIVLSEWTDMNPNNVHRMLHNATDWFAIKKGTTQSYAEAIKQGYFKTKVSQRMEADERDGRERCVLR